MRLAAHPSQAFHNRKIKKNFVLEPNIKLNTFTATLHISNNTTIKNLKLYACSFPNVIYFIHQILYLNYVSKTKNYNQLSFIISVPNRSTYNNHL